MSESTLLDGLHSMGRSDFFSPGDKRVLGWLKEAVAEGELINQADPAYPRMDSMMDYVLGNQLVGPRPAYLPKMILNQTKRAVRTHRAALTDIRPIFGFRTMNPDYQNAGGILNRLLVAWWINTFSDLRLSEAISYALTVGCGDVVVEFDPAFKAYAGAETGDNKLIVRDPRNTLAVRPGSEESVQSWEGVIIRETLTPNVIRAMWPERADAIMADAGSHRWGGYFKRFRSAVSNIISPVSSTLEGLRGGNMKGQAVPEVLFYRAYINDRSVNLNPDPVVMGKPGTNWCYSVAPLEPLYPRKRLILATEKGILYDGPNPYWHGLYPVSRLKLDPWPWTFMGTALCHDLLPVQDAINAVGNDFLSTFMQWTQRGMIADKNAMPESMFKRIDTRRPNWKAKVNPTMGEAFRMMDGPNLPPWSLEFFNKLMQAHESFSDTPNLAWLAQLAQMPSDDTIEAYFNKLTPNLKVEARLLECFLREIAEMIKVNIFQFYSKDRRVMILGDAGRTLEDFDYDPNTMVPSMAPGDKGYLPQLDKNKDRDARAQFFHRLFTFYVPPHSILALHAQQEQMKYVQLARQGFLDFWTLMEMLEVPNVGAPPPIPLPVMGWKPQADPNTGQPLPPPMEIREPTTITERLQAQQMMGIGQTVSPVGRKSSGQEPPHMVQKSDGSSTISESK